MIRRIRVCRSSFAKSVSGHWPRVFLWVCLPFALLASCGGGSGSAPSMSPNQIPITMASTNINTPVVSVTVCIPGTSTCQTIGNILLDTGSVGLRLSHTVLSIALPQVMDGANYVYECMQFAASETYGPVVTADVRLGSEPLMSSLMVQVSNHTLTSSSVCSPSAFETAFNGILGVGYPFSQYDMEYYYACSSPTACSKSDELSCSDTKNPSDPCHVSNPVFSLPVDNNGVEVTLPGVGTNGASSVTGTLTFGLGTQSDNSLAGLSVYGVSGSSACNSSFYLDATFTGLAASGACGFLDSGSNALFFGTTTFTVCSPLNNGWYCPSPSPTPLSLTLIGSNQIQNSFSLQVLNYDTSIAGSGKFAWNDLAGPIGSKATFDAGIDFFFGRTVAVGYLTSGQSPFWAF